MFSLKNLRRCCALSRNYHVAVVGGTSQVGQTLSLLLRVEPSVNKLTIHDTTAQTAGVLLDLSHIPAHTFLKGYNEKEALETALQKADIVIAAGGIVKKPGITKKEWFKTNSEFVKFVASKVGKNRPMPFFGIVTEPLNTLVPMAAEVVRSNGNYDPKKLFGITTTDVHRAQSLYASQNNLAAGECFVPVIGGHSEKTLIPLVSQSKPRCDMCEKSIREYINKVRMIDQIIFQAKRGWEPIASIAYGALVWTRQVIAALNEEKSVTVNALIENNDFGTSFFSGLVNLSSAGAGDMARYTELSQYECNLLEQSIEQLRKDVTRGKKILELD